MAIQVRSLIKEDRTNAGLSQKALAEKAGCVTASNISKAERDLKELTPEQLEAVADVHGVTPASLTDTEPVLTDADKELLKLFKSADADTQNAAVAVLKGEAAQNQNPMAAMMSMFGVLIWLDAIIPITDPYDRSCGTKRSLIIYNLVARCYASISVMIDDGNHIRVLQPFCRMDIFTEIN